MGFKTKIVQELSTRRLDVKFTSPVKVFSKIKIYLSGWVGRQMKVFRSLFIWDTGENRSQIIISCNLRSVKSSFVSGADSVLDLWQP